MQADCLNATWLRTLLLRNVPKNVEAVQTGRIRVRESAKGKRAKGLAPAQIRTVPLTALMDLTVTGLGVLNLGASIFCFMTSATFPTFQRNARLVIATATATALLVSSAGQMVRATSTPLARKNPPLLK